MPAVIAGRKRKGAESRARDLLDLLGIGDKAKQAPGVLSGGQRQRLAIARALANEPTLVLADEPTGALDSEGGEEVLELFRRLHQGGQTILLVTHDQPVADAAERIVRMKDGRVVDDGGRGPTLRDRRHTIRRGDRRRRVVGALGVAPRVAFTRRRRCTVRRRHRQCPGVAVGRLASRVGARALRRELRPRRDRGVHRGPAAGRTRPGDRRPIHGSSGSA